MAPVTIDNMTPGSALSGANPHQREVIVAMIAFTSYKILESYKKALPKVANQIPTSHDFTKPPIQ